MQDSNGAPLSIRLEHGPLVTPEALELARAFAAALRRLHAGGVVHGALEPSCVIVGGSGVSLRQPATTGLTPDSATEQVEGKGGRQHSSDNFFFVFVYR